MTTNYIFPGDWAAWMTAFALAWHQRSAGRFGVIITGIVLAQSRRTVTSWFRAAHIIKRYKAFYYFIGAVGKKTEIIATILWEIMIPLSYPKNSRVLMAIDDSPTKRYGPKVQGAGIHRNPTPGPQGHKFLYGHIWVSLSALVRHPSWGTMGLPLLVQMYGRAKVMLYGRQESKRVKLFQAAYRPAGGQVSVLIVREDDGSWRAFMCSNLQAQATEILAAVADRSAIEQNYHDLKEIEGAVQQQLRNFWANVGAFHLNMWIHTLMELWAWNKGAKVICDRRQSPWDDSLRRPSHADRRSSLRREVLKKTFFATYAHDRKTQKIVRQFYKLMKLASQISIFWKVQLLLIYTQKRDSFCK